MALCALGLLRRVTSSLKKPAAFPRATVRPAYGLPLWVLSAPVIGESQSESSPEHFQTFDTGQEVGHSPSCVGLMPEWQHGP